MAMPDSSPLGAPASREASLERFESPASASAAAGAFLNARIRAPEGIFITRWLNTAAEGQPPEMDLNALFAALRHWIPRDPALADELIQSAFAAQGPEGSLSRRVCPDGRVADATAPWPVLLAAAAPRADASSALCEWLIPRAEAYLKWARGHFDPDGDGWPQWPSAHGALLPDTWEAGLAGVDLTVLLLSEAAALRRMCAGGITLENPRALGDFEHALRRSLGALAIEDAPPFRDRYLDGRPAQRITLSCYFPLWLDDLALQTREQLAQHLELGPCAHPGGGFASWEVWPEDPAPAPVSPALQLFMLAGLEKTDPGAAGRAADRVRSRMETAWSVHGWLPADLAAEANVPAASGCEGIAAAVLAAPPPPRAAEPSRRRAWLERNRRIVLAAAVVLIALPLAGLALYLQRQSSLPGANMETLIVLGRESMNAGRLDEAERLLRDFLRRFRGTHGVAHLLLGNTLFKQGRYAEAEQEYRVALDDEASGTHALYNLGVTLQRQGRLPEAEQCMQTFVDSFALELPQYAERARLALQLIRQQQLESDIKSSASALLQPERKK